MQFGQISEECPMPVTGISGPLQVHALGLHGALVKDSPQPEVYLLDFFKGKDSKFTEIQFSSQFTPPSDPCLLAHCRKWKHFHFFV